jgi:hypoxanthine phosphoribosyltransferase
MAEVREPETLQDAITTFTRAELIFSRAEVEAALDRMAGAINARLRDANPLILCVMVGGVVPTGLLLPRLNFPLQVDYLHLTRYQGQTSGGELHWLKHPDVSLQDRTVLIIDDVLDEGPTLTATVAACRAEGAREVLTAVLVEKELERQAGMVRGDFVGLKTPNLYLFGYGMDYKTYLRNADGIYAVAT